MRLMQREIYIVFRALLYRQFQIAGSDTLLDKILKDHPEWQRFVDQKEANDKKMKEFRDKVLGAG